MKLHIRLFFLSLLLIVLAIVGVQMMNFSPSEALIAQSEATAYFITFVGVILSFRWFKMRATPVAQGEDVPEKNLEYQKKVLYILFGINVLNALILIFSQKESIQMMVGISLIVLLISPHIFRTMQEKEILSDDSTQSEAENKE